MIDLKTTEGLIFLSYLTNYNLQDIHSIINNDFKEEPIEYLKRFNSKSIEDAQRTTDLAIEKLKYFGITAISYYDKKAYPKQLRLLKDFPPVLYVRGKLVKKSFTAIVGSRESSQIAERKVTEITKVFLGSNFGIISGLALGIDTYAHTTAYMNGGYTIAVMPTSLDTIYPLENYKLANSIVKHGGALISELPLSINRGKKSFIERNRLQVAMSDFVMPVEMGINSGTMHTVNFCLRQNKKLVIPIPSQMVVEKYNHYYGGIIYLVDKFSTKSNNNVFFVNSITELKKLLGVKVLANLSITDYQQELPF